MSMNAEKLLKLADILDAAQEAHQRKGGPGYNQARYIHECGAPACAFGYWAAAHPERFETTPRGVSLRERPGRHRSEEHTSELQSRENLVCRLLLEKKKKHTTTT